MIIHLRRDSVPAGAGDHDRYVAGKLTATVEMHIPVSLARLYIWLMSGRQARRTPGADA